MDDRSTAEPRATHDAALTAFNTLRSYLESQILGQERLVERLLIALLADGHLLVEGPPGLAKTRAIKALAPGLDGSFQRVQFTPDMLPSDLTGPDIYRPDERSEEHTSELQSLMRISYAVVC